MNELDIARAIAAGTLTSPQKYENVWLWAIRITGTGLSYRSSIDEHVFRDKSLYLNDEFLARCSGLSVIWVHPDKALLDSKEFSERVIGSIFLPYISGEDVFGIAKIYDAEAAEEMAKKQYSTSPGVLFRDPSVNSKVQTENGTEVLVEGPCSLLDHVAIVTNGVWDKSGPPTGVLNSTFDATTKANERADSMSDTDMAAADKARKDADEAKAKADADAGQKLDKLLTHLDSITSRLDAMEMADKARRDSEEKEKADRADAARKDAAARRDSEHEEWKKADAEGCAKDDAEEEAEAKSLEEKGEPKEVAADKARKARKDRMDARKADADEKAKADADAARKDSQVNDAMLRRLAALEAMAKGQPEEERAAFADAQARADSPYISLGKRAPAPMAGESVLLYRIRLAKGVQKHSPDWKAIELHKLPVEALSVAEAKIYADADIAARNPDDIEVGMLREINKVDPSTGQRMTTFVGKGTFIGGMKRASRRVVGINTKAGA